MQKSHYISYGSQFLALSPPPHHHHPLNLLLWFRDLPPMLTHSTQGVVLMSLIWLLSVAAGGDTADVCFSPQDVV